MAMTALAIAAGTTKPAIQLTDRAGTLTGGKAASTIEGHKD
jgi:hypothetical protein